MPVRVTMDMGLEHISRRLPGAWTIKQSRTAAAVIMGHSGIPLCAMISVVGDDHWEEEYHEVLVFGVTPEEASRSFPSDGDTFRFDTWEGLEKFLLSIPAAVKADLAGLAYRLVLPY